MSFDLGLTPLERMLPAWQAEYGLAAPAADEFDYDQAVVRLKKCCHSNGYIHSPENAGIPASMTREEAWFWLRAMSTDFFHASKFKGKNAQKAPTASQVRKHLDECICKTGNDPGMRSVMSASWSPEMACALRALLSPAEMLSFIVENITAFEMSGLSQYNAGFGNLAAGCCMYFTPFLTKAECDHHAGGHRKLLLEDIDLTKPQSIASLVVLAVLGDAETVTQTLRQTKAKVYPFCSWLFARTASLDDFKELSLKHKQSCSGVNGARLVLATTGLSCLKSVRACVGGLKPDQTRVMKVLRRVKHPDIAPLMLELRQRHKDASAWLRENALLAAVGLSPHATDTATARSFWKELWQNDASTARLALTHLPAPVAGELESWGMASSAKVEEAVVLPPDLQEVLDAAPAKSLPSWLLPSSLPWPRFAGQQLDKPHVDALLTALQSAQTASIPPLVSLVRKHCDAGSLSDFVAALFKQWRQGAFPPADMWVLNALGWLGSDDMHLHLARHLVYQPINSPWPHARACAGVRALALAGTAVTISQIYRLAHATYESMQKKEAVQCLKAATHERGLDLEELADECVPDAGFDAYGRRFFSRGDVTVEARINAHLEVRFVWSDESERRRLPPQARTLSPAHFQRLCTECRRMRRLVRDTTEVQILRLREAVTKDFRRPMQVFLARVIAHPILSRLARQMVWQFIADDGVTIAFRPAEDGSFVDAHGQIVTLPSKGTVHLASVACLPQVETAAWIEHLADHGIIQPVKQLTAHACLPLASEYDLKRLNRFAGSPTTGGHLKRLFADEHWSHDKPQEGGDFTRHFRAYPAAALFACVRHSRVWMDNPRWGGQDDDERPAEIEDVWFIPDHFPKKEWRNSKHYLAIRDVPPAIFSEVFSLLHRMTGVPVPESSS